jgi:hypothetical protein
MTFQALGRPNPTMYSPRQYTTTEMPSPSAVIGRSYRRTVFGTSSPSSAMKCGTQVPLPPIANADRVSRRARLPPVEARERLVR